jgi:hypothetical protein
MANYHILSGKADGNQMQVVFHLPVPDVTNAVGVNYRNALIMHLGGAQESIVPVTLLGAGEQAALDIGTLYELVWAFNTHPGMTLADKRDALDAQYNQFVSIIVAQLQARLEFYGYSRDVP